MNLFLSRRGPTEISPWLSGAPLTALKKRNGGVGPIAVGETPGPLISSCAMAHVSKSAAEWLRSIQMGIATPKGCRAVVHGVRRFIEKRNDGSKFVFLSLDLSTAFNVVSHTAFLKGVKEHFPTLLVWVYISMGANGHTFGLAKNFSELFLDYNKEIHSDPSCLQLLYSL